MLPFLHGADASERVRYATRRNGMPLSPRQFAQAFGLALPAGTVPAQAAAPVFTHVAKAGDRWDTIAWRFYGDVSMMAALILTNPQLPGWAEFEPGVTVYVPPLARAGNSPLGLPPWRQSQ
jgi:phage tail protein X